MIMCTAYLNHAALWLAPETLSTIRLPCLVPRFINSNREARSVRMQKHTFYHGSQLRMGGLSSKPINRGLRTWKTLWTPILRGFLVSTLHSAWNSIKHNINGDPRHRRA